jgi:protease-4
MPLTEADLIVDRRRLKRHLSFWRVAAVLLAVGAVAAAVGRFGAPLVGGRYVARLQVAGIIIDDPRRLKALGELSRDAQARALIVRIDSPGGTVVGGEALFRELRRVAEKMPVVAVMAETAASGGYMTALGADWIVAREGTITGSIGVMMQSPDVTGLLEKLGVSVESIKSSPLKAVPSPFEPLTPEGRASVKALIDDMYAMFVDMVAERRRLDRARALEVADGRVFTGRQARALGLVDAIGGEDAARAWLETEKGVKRGLPVRDVRIGREDEFWREVAGQAVAAITGKSYLPERLTLDGLVAVWHPDLRSR